jgi:hypothetical protein
VLNPFAISESGYAPVIPDKRRSLADPGSIEALRRFTMDPDLRFAASGMTP